MPDMSMEPPSLVYITKSAAHVIEAEARHQSEGGQFKHETGGILIGRRLRPIHPQHLLIAAATRPGEQALHSAEEFNPDVAYVNRHLREYLAIYPKMDYIGVWHQHPPEFQTFSAGDVQSAQMICTDDDYRAREVINPIVWIRDNSFTIRYYYMNREMAAQQLPFKQIDSAKICVIDDDHPLIEAEKIRPSAVISRPPQIEEEYRRLTHQGYTVAIGAEDHYFYFKIQHPNRPDLVIYAVTPPTYPVDMPVLAVEQFERKVEFDEAALWERALPEGGRHLVDLAQALAAQIPVSSERITGRLALPSDAGTKRSSDRIALTSDTGAQPVGLLSAVAGLAGWLGSMAPLLILGILGIVVVAVAVVTSLWDIQDSPDMLATSAVGAIPTSSVIAKTAGLSPNISGTPLGELALRWQKVESASTLEQQIERIEAIRQAGIERDPSGTPTADRLLAARMQYADELAAKGIYDQAGTIVQQALDEAPTNSKQQAADQLATIYLSGGDSALARRDFVNAIRFYEQIDQIAPAPSSSLARQASMKLVDAQHASADLLVLQEAWHEYDNSLSLKRKIELIETKIEPITTWTPAAEKFPVQFYDPKTLNVAELWGQHCLEYARNLQLAGDLKTARTYFERVQQSPDVPSDDRLQANMALKNVDLAQSYWNTVVSSSSTQQDRATALRRLRALAGFGPGAQKPINGPTVAVLLATLIPTPAPTLTPELTPTAPLILVPTAETPAEPTAAPAEPTVVP